MAISTVTRQYVVFFDGTGNTAEDRSEITNVFKMQELLLEQQNRNSYYTPGVGTRVGEKLSGNVWGAGIRCRLEDAYRWLTDQMNYAGRELETAQLYIFGFSRGAYIARVFCWLLYHCGVPDDANLCPRLSEWFLNGKNSEIEAWKSSHSHTGITGIEILGLWDTVKTADFGDLDLDDVKLAPNVKNAFHAMALDELRNLFPVLRFNSDPRVHEVWFAGVHSDVGGGYPEPESGLSNITLQWMLDRAIEHGLSFRNQPPAQDISQPRHDEYDKPLWQGLCRMKDFLHPAFHRPVQPADLVHETVREKMEKFNYKPLAKFKTHTEFVPC